VNPQVTICNDSKTITWNSHKKYVTWLIPNFNLYIRYLLDLEHQGIQVVPSVLIPRFSTESEIEQAMKKKGFFLKKSMTHLPGWEMSIVKPSIGSFGNDVILLRFSEITKKSKHLRVLLQDQDLILQPFFSSVKTRGEISLIFLNGVFSHAIKKVPSNGDYKVQGGKVEAYEPAADEIQLSQRTLQASTVCIYSSVKALSIFLYARVDLLFSNTGTEKYISEVEILGKQG
jgi:glutathione synthase/RimK-type ligase-like ATP-grasp enzyme